MPLNLTDSTHSNEYAITDGTLGELVTAELTQTGWVAPFTWEFKAPLHSAAAHGPFVSTGPVTFTADVPGTYTIWVYDSAGNESTAIYSVPTVHPQARLPGFKETTQAGAAGWHSDMTYWLQSLADSSANRKVISIRNDGATTIDRHTLVVYRPDVLMAPSVILPYNSPDPTAESIRQLPQLYFRAFSLPEIIVGDLSTLALGHLAIAQEEILPGAYGSAVAEGPTWVSTDSFDDPVPPIPSFDQGRSQVYLTSTGSLTGDPNTLPPDQFRSVGQVLQYPTSELISLPGTTNQTINHTVSYAPIDITWPLTGLFTAAGVYEFQATANPDVYDIFNTDDPPDLVGTINIETGEISTDPVITADPLVPGGPAYAAFLGLNAENHAALIDFKGTPVLSVLGSALQDQAASLILTPGTPAPTLQSEYPTAKYFPLTFSPQTGNFHISTYPDPVHETKFIVSREYGPYTTIQSAINAAKAFRDICNVDQIVYITPYSAPRGYWEEDLILYEGISLKGITSFVPQVPNTNPEYRFPLALDVASAGQVRILAAASNYTVYFAYKTPARTVISDITFLGKDAHVCCYLDNTDYNHSNIQFVNCRFEATTGASFFHQNATDSTTLTTVAFKDCYFLADNAVPDCFLLGSDNTDFSTRSSFFFDNCYFVNAGPDNNSSTPAFLRCLTTHNALSIKNCYFFGFCLSVGAFRASVEITDSYFCNVATPFAIFEDVGQAAPGFISVRNCTFQVLNEYVFGARDEIGYTVRDQGCTYLGITGSYPYDLAYHPDYVDYETPGSVAFTTHSEPEQLVTGGTTVTIRQGVTTVLVTTDSSTDPTNITLPPAHTCPGRTITVWDVDGHAGANSVIVSNAIGPSHDLTHNNQAVTYKSMSGQWRTISSLH